MHVILMRSSAVSPMDDHNEDRSSDSVPGNISGSESVSLIVDVGSMSGNAIHML